MANQYKVSKAAEDIKWDSHIYFCCRPRLIKYVFSIYTACFCLSDSRKVPLGESVFQLEMLSCLFLPFSCKQSMHLWRKVDVFSQKHFHVTQPKKRFGTCEAVHVHTHIYTTYIHTYILFLHVMHIHQFTKTQRTYTCTYATVKIFPYYPSKFISFGVCSGKMLKPGREETARSLSYYVHENMVEKEKKTTLPYICHLQISFFSTMFP